MNDYLVVASILVLAATCAVSIAWLSNFIGNLSACKVMEAEKSRPGRRMGGKKKV
jgi:hypothetical protein